MLEQLGCGFGQGYLWSRPAPLDQVVDVGTVPPRRPHSRPNQVIADRVRALVESGASPHSIAAALNADGLRTADRGRTALARQLGHRAGAPAGLSSVSAG